MKKIKESTVKKMVMIVTIILYCVAIATYELLFCNSQLLNNIIRNARNRRSWI